MFFSIILLCISVSFASLLVLRPFAVAIGLVDKPSDRKLHSGSVPLIGGISIFVTVVVYAFYSPILSEKLLPLLATGSILFLIGVIDDYRSVGVRIRVFIQVVCALAMIWMTDLKIESLGYLFGPTELHVGFVSIPLTVLAVVGVTNAFNLVDGIDGLAGSMALVAIVGILLFQSHLGINRDYGYIVALGAAITPYLILNICGGRKFKVFMGDAGSLFIGYVIVWTLIHQTQSGAVNISPASALWCIAIPLIDTIGVMSRRLLKGDSPFKPDRNHLHHILLRAGFSSFGALVFLFLVSTALLIIGLFLESYAADLSFMGFLAVFVIYTLLLLKAWKVQKILKYLKKTFN